MKKHILLFFFLLTSCIYAQKGGKECKYYKIALNYFNSHYHNDYMDEGSPVKSIKLFEKAVKAGCKTYDLFYKLYYCYQREEDYKNAEKYISLAIELDTLKNIELHYWKGELNMHLARLEEAFKDYTAYVNNNKAKDPMHGYYCLGVIQYVQGDTLNSKLNMSKAVKLNNGKEMRDFESYAKSWGLIK